MKNIKNIRYPFLKSWTRVPASNLETAAANNIPVQEPMAKIQPIRETDINIHYGEG